MEFNKSAINEFKSNFGHIFAFASSALYGSISTIAKPTVESINPIWLACLVSFFSAAVLFPGHIRSKTKMEKKSTYLIILISALGAVLAPLFYFSGIEMTKASDATVLSNSEIIFTVILASILFKEKLGRNGRISMIFIFFGIFTLNTNFNIEFLQINFDNFGNWLILGTMFFWSFDNNLSKIVTKTIDVSKLIFLKSILGGLILFFIIVVFGIPMFFEISDIPNVILLSIVSFALPMYFFYQAIKRIGTIKTILIFSTSPIFGVTYAAIFLGEVIQSYHLISISTMLVGILILFRYDR